MPAATFGTVEYRGEGVVAVPITFDTAVVAPAKTAFKVSRVSGDDLYGIQYRLVGENTDYTLIFEIPTGRSGQFSISARGQVINVSTGAWERVTATAVNVDYGTIEPRLVDYDIPGNYNIGEPVDIRFAFNVPVTGWNLNNTLTEIFIEEGARLGSEIPYKWTGSSPPDIHAPTPETLTGTDWTLLAAPPAGEPTPGTNGFDNDGQWHGEEGQYFLIRFPDPQSTGIVNLTLRENAVRGPTS